MRRESARAPRSAGSARAAGSARGRPRRRRDARRRGATTSSSSTPVSRSCHGSCRPATCSSSTPRRRCRPRSTPTSPGDAVELWLSTPGAATAPGSSSCERANERATRVRPSAARLDLPGGAEVAARSHASPASERLCRRTSRARRAARGLPSSTRAADPLRLRPRAVAARDLPDRVRAASPGSAEMPSAGPALHRGARHGARSARRPPRAHHSAHRRLLARAAASRPTPSASRFRARRPGSSTPSAAGAGA